MADMFFDYLKAITVMKANTDLPLDDYNHFLINRWMSFMTPAIANVINCTVNQLKAIDKHQHYQLMLTMIPKSKYFKKMAYIKKTKKDKENKEAENIKRFAICNEISVREIEMMIETNEKLSKMS